MMIKPGTPLFVTRGLHTYPLAVVGTLDPREAMSSVLAAYLADAEFARWGGGVDVDQVFKLKRVDSEWPSPETALDWPQASVIEQGPVQYAAHNFTPSCLEDSWNVIAPNTVLWKTDEVVADFQVDFWVNTDPDRQAVMARLPHLFSPGEDMRGVLLAGDPRYYGRTVRATLLDHQRFDNSADVLQRERRVMAHVRCEVDNVHLRCAVGFAPRIMLKVTEGANG